jgi:DNA-binding MarR family transcriptional regulator
MVSESLVYRIPDPSDRRRILIPLAPAGKVLYKRLRNISAAQGQRLEKQLRQGKVEVLRNLLRELMDS